MLQPALAHMGCTPAGSRTHGLYFSPSPTTAPMTRPRVLAPLSCAPSVREVDVRNSPTRRHVRPHFPQPVHRAGLRGVGGDEHGIRAGGLNSKPQPLLRRADAGFEPLLRHLACGLMSSSSMCVRTGTIGLHREPANPPRAWRSGVTAPDRQSCASFGLHTLPAPISTACVYSCSCSSHCAWCVLCVWRRRAGPARRACGTKSSPTHG